MRQNDKVVFKYNARDCNDFDICTEALQYYNSIKNEIIPAQIHNYHQCVNTIEKKLIKFAPKVNDIPTELLNKNRLFYYHNSIILAVEFLKPDPHPESISALFYHLTGALNLNNVAWSVNMYTDLSLFSNAFTPKEKVIQFIYNLLTGGLHEKNKIIYLINQYIKIVNILQLNDKLSVDLPNRKILHDISIADIPDYFN